MTYPTLRQGLFGVPSALASDVTVTTASPKTWSAAPSQSTYRSLFRTTNNELISLYSDTGHLYYRKSADNGGSWGSATQIKYNDDFTGYDFDAFMEGSLRSSTRFVTVLSGHSPYGFTIGATSDQFAPPNSYFGGTIDDVRIYSRPLADGDVAALAQGW